jgi:hypothetical protein
MWGNMQGWLISAVMLLGSAGMLYVIAMPAQESTKSGLIPKAFKPVALPASPDSVQPAGSKDCDAGELYRQAIQACLSDPKSYDPNVYGNIRGVDLTKLPGVELVRQAADCSRMHLFETNPTQAVNYHDKKAWIEAVMALGQTTDDAALRVPDDQPKKAEELYKAAFALGRRLYEERVTWDELNKGLSIMTMTSGAMAKLADNAKDGPRVDLLSDFNSKVGSYQSDLQDSVASPLGNPVESYGAKYAGDVFAVAKDPKLERCWRVEAILHLGRYRWNVADNRKGDQMWAGKELTKLELESDPVIRTAVQAAKNLTQEQQFKTGSGQ